MATQTYNKVNFTNQDVATLQSLAGELTIKGWTIPSGKPTAKDYTPFECVNSVSISSLSAVAASLKKNIGETETVGNNRFMANTGVIRQTNKQRTILSFVEHAEAFRIWKMQNADLRKELNAKAEALKAEIDAQKNANMSVQDKEAQLSLLMEKINAL